MHLLYDRVDWDPQQHHRPTSKNTQACVKQKRKFASLLQVCLSAAKWRLVILFNVFVSLVRESADQDVICGPSPCAMSLQKHIGAFIWYVGVIGTPQINLLAQTSEQKNVYSTSDGCNKQMEGHYKSVICSREWLPKTGQPSYVISHYICWLRASHGTVRAIVLHWAWAWNLTVQYATKQAEHGYVMF